MAKAKPTDIYPGYDLLAPSDSVTVAGIFIPLTAIPALNAAEADPETGDGMEVFRSLQHGAYKGIAALSEGSRPIKATITKEPNNNLPNGNYQAIYINRFELQFSDEAATIAAE